MTVLRNEHLSWLPYIVTIILLYVTGFSFLWIARKDHHISFGVGILAYTLGLCHALDADHITAIDDMVRKLLQQRKDPSGVGFCLLIGHSSVVFLMVVFLRVPVKWAKDGLPHFRDIGGATGTPVSGFFLVLIGMLDLIILISLISLFARPRHEYIEKTEVDALLESRGFVSRFVGPYFKLITCGWHVLPPGLLFGLGLDIASEIVLLVLSSGASQQAISFTGILSLLTLSVSGMNLLDTSDGIIMKHAYSWAFFNPIRKIYYNTTIAVIPVIAALVIGMIELLQTLIDKLDLHGAFWIFVGSIEFDYLGYILVALFLIAWFISSLIWKFGRIEHKWSK